MGDYDSVSHSFFCLMCVLVGWLTIWGVIYIYIGHYEDAIVFLFTACLMLGLGWYTDYLGRRR